MGKSSRERQEVDKRRRKYEEEKKRQRRVVELKMVPRTVQGTTSTKKAATASTATTTKQTHHELSSPPKNINSDLNETGHDNQLDEDTLSEHSSSQLSQSQSRTPSPLPLLPLSSRKRKRIQEATGLTEDEIEDRRCKLQRVIDIMEYDVATKLVSKGVEIDKYHNKARLVPRTVHLFINVLDVLMFGRTYREEDFDWDMEDDDEDDEDDADDGEDRDDGDDGDDGGSSRAKRTRELGKKRELFYQYHALLDIIPNLKTDIHIMDDEDIECLAAYIQRECGKARSTDSSHLLDRILVYYRTGLDIDSAKMPAAIEKPRRGWSNFYTARALVPPNALDTVTKDWKKWCQLILNKKVHIVAEDWPSVLFDLNLSHYNEDAELLDGCLRGPTFVMAVKSLLTGPISAMTSGGRPEKVPGKPPLAIHYKIKTMTPRLLAYVAVLVRHSFVRGDWSVMDGEFNNHEFYNSILAMFKEPLSPWAQDLLDWYDCQVFGNMTPKTSKQLTAGRMTMAQLIRGAVKEAKKGKGKQVDNCDDDRSHSARTPFESLNDSATRDLATRTEETEDAVEDSTEDAAPHTEESVPTSPARVEGSSSSDAA